MPKKPRQKPVTLEQPQTKQEFVDCDAPDCHNIIALWTLPKGYFESVYCVLHTHLAKEVM